MNAKLNNVSLEIKKEDLIGRHGHFENWDCILIGDLFYEFSLMKTLVIMLRNARRRGKRIFLAEPCGIFRAYTLKDELRPVAQYHLPKVSSEILGYGMTVVSEFFV
ncbi:Electron transfer flavoprotein beta subunit lysine methyltransferase [Homalodisca vitripennis]|nr:Electron transfer flavoprotein beta subunit lysine methyltransferase [Homalodisca vitripennis]